MPEYVFFETSTLISASVRDMVTDADHGIEHKFYDESKGLANCIEKNRIIGITTITVEDQANEVIEEALLDNMPEKIDEIKKHEDKFRTYSIVLTNVQKNLRNILKLMDRLRIDQQEVGKIVKTEIIPMYYIIEEEVLTPPPPTWSSSPRFKTIAKKITADRMRDFERGVVSRLEKKSIIPDSVDLQILGECVYIRRVKLTIDKMFLASLDNHFSGMKDPYTKIPEEISKRFSIICKTPIAIIESLN